MTYRVRVDPHAQREIDQFAVYLRAYDDILSFWNTARDPDTLDV